MGVKMNRNQKSILVIGFQKYGTNMYPHLKVFIDSLSNYCNIEYFFFRERGLFFNSVYSYPTKPGSYARFLMGIAYSILDTLKLARNQKKFDSIIAIDAYAYAIASKIKGDSNLILWSHDIIGSDHPLYNTFFVKYIHFYCARSLIKNKKIIIQDPKRQEILLHAIGIAGFNPDVYYMPVFIEKIPINRKPSLSSFSRPIILQCGGIGRYRSSDKILDHFQSHADAYRLVFHGFLIDDILSQLEKCHAFPIVSSTIIDSKYLYQIIDFCDIGFISYEKIDLNHKYLSKASGQMVEFLRLGKPVIVMSKSDLKEFVNEEKIGVGIEDISELENAIKLIKDDYDTFSINCIKCFDNYFKSDLYIPNILRWI